MNALNCRRKAGKTVIIGENEFACEDGACLLIAVVCLHIIGFRAFKGKKFAVLNESYMIYSVNGLGYP